MSGTGARGRECWLLKLIWKLLRLPCEHARLDEPLSNFLRFSLSGELELEVEAITYVYLDEEIL